MKQSFLLVSLKEDKAKELAEVIANESCRRILDYLSEKQDTTESELAQKLAIPISTVHYNLQHLVKVGIITIDEFHYSEKGRRINHYKLANKYIIIAPKTTYGIKEKLKSILPVTLLAMIGAGVIHIYTKYLQSAITASAIPTNIESTQAAEKGLKSMTEEISIGLAQTTTNYSLWFLSGCVFVIVLIIIFELIKKFKEK